MSNQLPEFSHKSTVYPATPDLSADQLTRIMPASGSDIKTKNPPDTLFERKKSRRVTKPRAVYHVQLAAYRSLKRAEMGWRELVRKAPKLLGELDHVIVKPDAKFNVNGNLRLRSEAFIRRSDANNLCNALKRKKLKCFVVKSWAAPVAPETKTKLGGGLSAQQFASAVINSNKSDVVPLFNGSTIAAVGNTGSTRTADGLPKPLRRTLLSSTSVFLKETVKIASIVRNNEARIVLTWQKPVGYVVEEKGSDLLIRFDRAIGGASVADISSNLKSWVNNVSTSYDTLFLQAKRGVRFVVAKEGTQINIDLAAVRGGKSTGGSIVGAEDPKRLQLALLEAQLLLALGKQENASKLLAAERLRHPDNPYVLTALADLENQSGRWRNALALYDRALIMRPLDEDILLARRSIIRGRAPYLNVAAEYVRTGDQQTQYKLSTTAQYNAAETLSIGFQHEIQQLKAKDVRRVDGQIRDFNGTRQRGEIYAVLDLKEGHLLRASLFVAEEIVGVGTTYAIPDIRGVTQVTAELNRPSWDFTEGFVAEGVRHQIGVRREHRFTPRVSGQAGTYARIYGINGDRNVASSFAVQGGLQYLIFPKSPTLSVGYQFDGEYRASIESRADQNGELFDPIPLVTREIHALQATTTYDLRYDWRASAYAGYGIDRFATGGAYGGIALVHQGDGPLQARIFAESGLSTSIAGERAIRVGVSLTWRF